MNPRIPEGLQTETTPEGEQTLVPGVRPITQRERLETLMCAPLTTRRAQKPLNIGLFDEDGRAQQDILDFIRTAEHGAPSPTQTKE
jgi:hypothetical protein